MDPLRKFLERLFKSKKKTYQVPFLHESFDFDMYADAYVSWKKGKAHLALSQIITDSYDAYSAQGKYPSGVNFIKNKIVAGVAIKTNAYPYTKKDYIYLCTHLKETLLDQGYIQHLSEIKSKEDNGSIRQYIKIYLKPSRKNVRDGKNEQFYGNVSMEISSINEQLLQFKLSCSYYQDQHFNDPWDFDLFLDKNIKHA